MKAKKDKSSSLFGIILMILILLIIFIILIVSYLKDMISSNDFFIVFFLLLLMSIPIFLKIKQIKKPKESNAQESSIIDSSLNKEESFNENQDINGEEITSKKGSKPNPNRIFTVIPIFVLAFIFIYVFIGNPFEQIFGVDPVGKWYDYYEVGNGNLTEYWYIIFEEDGTLVTGIKNVGFAEDPEGTGTWYVENGILHVYIHPDYSGFPDQNLLLEIKGNKLYELSGTYTGYEKG